jgi:hypothetical protein
MTTAVIQMMGMSPPKATGIDASVVNAGEAAPTGDGGVDVSGYTRVAVVLVPTGSPACALGCGWPALGSGCAPTPTGT